MNDCQEECPICLDTSYYLCITKCKHSICIKCLLNLYYPVCPLCRKSLDKELPQNVLDIIKKNKPKTKRIENNGLDIRDLDDFPPL